jgi:lycopene cyclase domain-containing protein
MPEYTLLAVLSVVGTVLLERWLRVGLFRRLQYWIAMAIVFAFQVPVDGWLTKLSAPIVLYAPEQHLGLRWPWDIPVEDFLFGFSMVTLCLVLWERAKAQGRAGPIHTGSDCETETDTGTETGHADTRSST